MKLLEVFAYEKCRAVNEDVKECMFLAAVAATVG